MANTLTAIAPAMFGAAQVVSNEPTSFLSAIDLRFDSKGVSYTDVIKVPVAPVRTSSTFTPSMTVPTGDDSTASTVTIGPLTFDKVSWNFTGEQEQSLANSDTRDEFVRQTIVQGMRRLRNNAETAAALAAKQGASRAVGTAGTNPFATNLDTLADARKVLQDNGAPLVDLQFVMDTSASVALRKLGIFQQAYAAGSDTERRSGNILPQFGFSIGESAWISTHTKGTGASYVTSGSTAVGVTDVALVTGTGTVLAGDVVTFAADATNKYVVGTGVAAPGTISLNRPGARVVIATANALTVGNNFTPNMAFERHAIVGIMRPPIMPQNPIISQMQISDGRGMTYLMVEIAGYGMRTWELHLAYAFKAVQPEHIVTVMG